MNRLSMSTLSILATLTVLTIHSTALSAQGEMAAPSAYYDTDRDEWLVDTDGDGTVDLSEEIGGTDPYDATVYPGSDSEPVIEDKVGFPSTSCRSGFRSASSRLCISIDERNATRYYYATTYCRDRRARVCTYEDMYYLYHRTSLDSSYNTYGMWLGDFVYDDIILCGNKHITYNNDPDIYNFEGHCHKREFRQYYCCHDRE